MTVIALGAGYAETCKSGSGGGSAETAAETQYGAVVPTSHTLTLRLNVNAGRLMSEYHIAYENTRTHAGRRVKLSLQPAGA